MTDPERDETASGRDIAVIGLAGRFPRARDLDAFWRNLQGGVEAVTFFSDEELLAAGDDPARLADPTYIKAGSVLDGADEFDAGFFGYTAGEAEILDPQQRLFLEHCWQALENAGHDPGRTPGLIGVYAGVAWNTYLLTRLAARPELFAGGGGFQVFITNDKDFMATRVSYKLNLKGPSLVLQTSCSTSLVAIHVACLSLLNYECDMALAGGVTVKVPQVEGYTWLEGGLASPDGHCRAFDAAAQGTIFGSGVGVVVLKRLADAIADGDRIRAVIKGSAINNDGSVKVSYTAPSVEGQAEVIAAAQAVAGVDAGSISYVECHGTGTSLGDPIEVAALTKVFRESTDRTGFCALGSVKTNVGHLDAAAGVAGFLKTVLALEHGQIPPSLHYSQPNPKIDFAASPFFVNAALRDWPAEEGSPRRAGVSSFGVGGTNAHLILEEAPPVPAPAPSRAAQLLLLSARSPAALEEATANLAAAIAEAPELPLADAAYTLRVGRAVFRHRRAVVCRDRAEAVAALSGQTPEKVFTAADTQEPRQRPVIFLFPGQGVQHPGMARDLYREEPVFRQELDRCAELLRPHLGLDLREVLFSEGDRTDLSHTALAQPALFAVEYALAQLWMSWGIRPQALAGHSLGEYVAACLAGVFSLEDALALVAERGRLMGGLPAGVMLSVPLGEEEAAPLLAPFAGRLSLAAVNEPSRSVVSGPEEAIAGLERELAARGLDGRRLHTSHAFHSAMMDPILAPFAERVRRVRRNPPRLPWLSNLTGTWITPEQAIDPEAWARQLRSPVRFAALLGELAADPERIFLEVGPGRTLATFARRVAPANLTVTSLPAPTETEDGQETLLAALGRLWLAGVEIDWTGFHADEERRRVPLPAYPFERQRYWIDGGSDGRKPAAQPAAAQEVSKRPSIDDWFYVPVWSGTPAPRPVRPGDLAEDPRRRWLVVPDRGGVGAALAERLAAAGADVVTAPADGLAAALDRLPRAVVWAASLDAPGEGGFLGLVELARALTGAGLGTRDDAPVEIWVLTDRAHRVTGAEEVAPWAAAVLGPCRVIPQEMPAAVCQSVDVDLAADPAPAGRLLAEIAAGPAGRPVAWRGGRRWLQSFEPARLDPAGRPLRALRDKGVYLITGGLEGNGWGVARFLAESAGARLVLPESAPLSELKTARVQALEAAGAEVLVVPAEPQDEAALAWAVSQAVERFGALHGAIHAAAVVGERTFRPLADTGAEEAAWHFAPRAHGLLALDAALAGRELDFRLALSSLAAVLGGVGYAAYAASHLFVDAFAQATAGREDGGWLAVGWDLWDLGGEAGEPDAAAVSASLAALAMTPAEGAEVFRRVLAAATAEVVEVSTAGLAARLARTGRRSAPAPAEAGASGSSARHPRPSLQIPYAAPESDLERRIAAVWQELLGFSGIGVDDNFFELGGDSFIAVRVAARLREALGTDLPVAQLYQRLTVRSLAELLGRDESQATAELAARLDERRESMDRRKEMLRRRRERKETVET